MGRRPRTVRARVAVLVPVEHQRHAALLQDRPELVALLGPGVERLPDAGAAREGRLVEDRDPVGRRGPRQRLLEPRPLHGRHHPARGRQADGQHRAGLQGEGQALVPRRRAGPRRHLLAPAGEPVGRVEVVVARHRVDEPGQRPPVLTPAPERGPAPAVRGAGVGGVAGEQDGVRRRVGDCGEHGRLHGLIGVRQRGQQDVGRPGGDHVGQVRERGSPAHPPTLTRRRGPTATGRPYGSGLPERGWNAGRRMPMISTRGDRRRRALDPRAPPGRGRPPRGAGRATDPGGVVLAGGSAGPIPAFASASREDVAMLPRAQRLQDLRSFRHDPVRSGRGTADRFCKLPRGRRRSRPLYQGELDRVLGFRGVAREGDGG